MKQNSKILPNEAVMREVEAMIGEGEQVVLTVNSGSMHPFLHIGDRVKLAPVATSELRRGDVVLFRYGGHHILHRIRHIRGNRLEIRGDHNLRQTELATRADVAARVSAIYHGTRFIRANSCRWYRRTAASLVYNFLWRTKRCICK